MPDTHRPSPLLLIILDGWGYREDKADNAIAAANTPTWDRWWANYPHTLLSASGLDVGLPEAQMGNSEVGHMTIGSGRPIYQDLTRISQTIADDALATNQALNELFTSLEQTGGALHCCGLLSPGGVHSHEAHLFELLKIAKAKGVNRVYVHAFLDGRDTPPASAKASLEKLEHIAAELGQTQCASIIGRYYAMDRDQRFERTESCYNMLVSGKAKYCATNAVEALELAYARGENDEFVQATTVCGDPSQAVTITDGDALLFFNFRSDRARQLTRAFVQPEFTGFVRTHQPKLASFTTMTQYASDLADLPCLFPKQMPEQVFAELLSANGLRQLRAAETEKYAHVTFFFNGGRDEPFPGEARQLIPSPKVATYDLQPEMSAKDLTDCLVSAITEQTHDVIICNYANPDMVGHTGNFTATVQAIEELDRCFARLDQALQQVHGEALVTADHGNAENMYDHESKQANTAHTTSPVPLLYLGRRAKLKAGPGVLADIAPTMLALLGIPKPSVMTGESLAIEESPRQ